MDPVQFAKQKRALIDVVVILRLNYSQFCNIEIDEIQKALLL